MRNDSFLNATAISVLSNSASDLAGGIGIFDNSSFLCYSCVFEDNTSLDGAGVYIRLTNKTRSRDAQLQDCRFVRNSASANGGIKQ